MDDEKLRYSIARALAGFSAGDLVENGRHLLGVLGYQSRKAVDIAENSPQAFLGEHDERGLLNPGRGLVEEWQSASLVFQLTDAEIASVPQLSLFDSSLRVHKDIIQSYLFVALSLQGEHYTRTQLAGITREVNKLFPMPVLILFRHGQALTLSVTDRRLHKRDQTKDVLEKVTLIKDIAFAGAHRAHVEILHDLSLGQLGQKHRISSFGELHAAWRSTLDISELNKRFFREVADWFFWATENVVFPIPAGITDEDAYRAQSVIRLITRLIFCWFLREMDLIPEAIFNREKLGDLLVGARDLSSSAESTYYKAVLQNLFFATLNQEMDARDFRKPGASGGGRARDYLVTSLYRYRDLFQRPEDALQLFARIPFVNGGLFDCLDRDEANRVDGFSDRPQNPLQVPDYLFFGREREVDLNATYDTQNKRYTVRGLIDILGRYKFTIEENTPLDEEVALDPELLGKVFENLLAAYNPETGVTARKQTGSFYTPREVVDYMVDESLLAYLESMLRPAVSQEPQSAKEDDLSARLRHLLAYNDGDPQFSEEEVARLIDAIDCIRVLDPACGSGAFPIGMLHKLVFILRKLDPQNRRWKDRQLAKAGEFTDSTIRERAIADIEQAFERNELDYGRKLYLLQNCIYGVDIQPIAVQIAKLRCFIALIIDQRVDDSLDNRGIRPLPNLETKFVAANSLLPLPRPPQPILRSDGVLRKEEELAEARRRHFDARTRETKKKYERIDQQLRAEIAELLAREGMPAGATSMVAHWDPYDQNASARFFDPEWMFGITDGFDIAIGNPPYVRQEQIKELKPLLQEHYTCYTGTADLYVYFFERALQLLKTDGILTYISSNKYFRSQYGEGLRKLLAGRTVLRQLIDFGDAPVFRAIAYPSIVVLQKNVAPQNRVGVLSWVEGRPIEEFPAVFRSEGFCIPQSALTAGGWQLESQSSLQLLAKLRQAGQPLGSLLRGRLYRGILTGLNQAFVVDRVTRDRLVAEDPSSADILRPFLRGRDVKRWQTCFAGYYLVTIESSENRVHPWSGSPPVDAEKIFARTYPAIDAHLRTFHARLVQRRDQGRHFWELRSCAYWREFERPKIIYPDIYEHQSFAIDTAGYYCGNTCYFIPSDETWLCGLLNSQLVEWYYSHISSKVRGGYMRAFTDYVQQIPIPVAASTEAIGIVVDKILAIKNADPQADVSGLEREIDDVVYRLYGLTKDEVAIVEER